MKGAKLNAYSDGLSLLSILHRLIPIIKALSTITGLELIRDPYITNKRQEKLFRALNLHMFCCNMLTIHINIAM